MLDNPILKRQDNESLKDWKIRICENKSKYDLTWQEISEIINSETGDNFGESAYRKWWNAFKEGMDYTKKQNMTSDDVLNELEKKKIELLEERKKLQAIRTEYNKIAREKSQKELLFEFVKDSFEKLDVPEPLVNLSYGQNPEKEYLLSFGDIHFGKKFESVHNTYSEEIAMNRMNAIIEDTVKYLQKEDVTCLNVLNLADNIEGMTLRLSQLQSLQSGFVDQVIKFSKFYAKWIRELSKYTYVNLHHIEQSNHSEIRPFSTGRSEFPSEDMERIIGMYIQDVLDDHERIKINLHKDGIAEFDLVGYKIISLHGHQFNGKKSNILKDISFHRRKFYDYMIQGHWHELKISTVGESTTNNVQIISVPSVMGSDTYSDSLLVGAKAGALITTFTEGKGLTDTHNIILN